METETQNEDAVFVLPVIREKLSAMIGDERSTFADFARVLVFQPQVVAHLLKIANSECCEREHRKPTNVHAIIGLLGTSRVEREVLEMKDASLEQEGDLRALAVDSYELATVFAFVAECRLGRKDQARDFFMIGLLSKLAQKDPHLFDDCHEGVRRAWKFFPGGMVGSELKGDPSMEEAYGLVAQFRKAKNGVCGSQKDLYDAWCAAAFAVRNVLDSGEEKWM